MKKYYIVFDKYERGIIINALNDKRNALIKEGRYTEVVDDVLWKSLIQTKRDLRLNIRRIKLIKKTIFEQIGGIYTKWLLPA